MISQLLPAVVAASFVAASTTDLVKVEPDPAAGFHWPYYLLIPKGVETPASSGGSVRLLIIPNNTGMASDDLAIHERQVVRMMNDAYRLLAESLDAAVLSPVFPRPRSHAHIYTHALDRDSLTTDLPGLRRLDLQLAAMQDHAVARLRASGWKVDRKAALLGFSASGMFANRFTVLHPDRVFAAVIGSPGGWPLALVPIWRGHRLRYPVGVDDLESLTGFPVDVEKLRAVPLFLFMGAQDDNDSVGYDDGYDADDRALVYELFGRRPMDRWEQARRIYASCQLNATFRLYPEAGHEMTPRMIEDVVSFLRNLNWNPSDAE